MQQDKFNLKKQFKKSFLAAKSPTKSSNVPQNMNKTNHNNRNHSHSNNNLLPMTTSVQQPSRLSTQTTTTSSSIRSSTETPSIPFDKLPEAFLKFHQGDFSKAKDAYARTLAWRREHRMESLFEQPQPFFHEILQYYPHAIHGRSRDGAVVLYEVLGQMKPQELTKLGIYCILLIIYVT